MNKLEDVMRRDALNRRGFLARIGAAGLGAAAAGALLAGCGGGGENNVPPPLPPPVPPGGGGPTPPPPTGPLTDADILNFALNLEYLEAEYYLRAIGAQSLTAGIPSTGPVTGGRTVTFATPAIRQYAEEIALDEFAHVRFLRGALGGNAVARPALDLQNSFNAAAQAAGIGPSFDPFASELNFLIGAFIFEDVGVTAYKGAAPLITSPTFLQAAAGILAVEAYHAGEVRTVLYNQGAAARNTAQQISTLRAGAGGGKDEGIVKDNQANLVPTDGNALAFSRTTSEVLRIVYLSPSGNPASGGFFPNGLNGRIAVAA